MSPYDLWSAQYPEAAAALRAITVPPPPPPGQGSEQRIQSAVRLEAARKGYWLGRNNSGVLMNDRGVPVRFGLGNDNAAVNKVFKTGDLIGWKETLILPEHVGTTMARFVSAEIKGEKGRVDPGQLNWATLVNSRGGLGLIINQEGMLP
jgi:hypothetical protein